MQIDSTPRIAAAVHGAVARIRALADQCVACGLCLPHCPTYQLTRRESESPRGRIALMRAIAAASEALDATSREHCLACGRCERVCPADVRYLDLLDLSRSAQRPARPRWLALASRLRRRIATSPLAATLAALGAAAQRSPRLSSASAALRVARSWRRPPDPTTAVDTTPTPALFVLTGCGSGLQDDAVDGALRLLARAGVSVTVAPPHACCGALERHAGDAEGALRSLQQLTDAVAASGAGRIAALDSGCTRELRRHRPGADVTPTDLLTVLAAALDANGRRFHGGGRRVGVYRPCTLDATGAIALDRLLGRIDDLEVVSIEAGHGCCGAAGEYFLDQPALSARLAAPLAEAIAAARVDAVVTVNLGCRLQLAARMDHRGDRTPVLHLLGFMASLPG